MANPNPLPTYDEIAQRPRLQNGEPNANAYRVGETWLQYFAAQSQSISASSQRLTLTTVTAQNASIGATSLGDASLSEGLYRVTWFAAITTAAGVSSSLTVTVNFTHLGVAKTFSGAAITGNTTATWQSETKTFLVDGGSPITYATTYASNAAGAMQYALAVLLEQPGQS